MLLQEMHGLKRSLLYGIFACVVGLPVFASAQAVPTASRVGALQAGVGGTIASPDYGRQKIKGLSLYSDLDLTSHIGAEVDIHFVNIITPDDVGEKSYFVGPRFFINRKRFTPYVKTLVGFGSLKYQPGHGTGVSATYFAYSLGAGLDINVTRSINVRAIDVEFQQWPNFAPRGLTPIVTTIGVAYSFH